MSSAKEWAPKTWTGTGLQNKGMVSIMKKRSIFLFIILSLAVLIGFIGTASAQNIDVDDMDNEQLMLLLQSIMQKLEGDQVPDTDVQNTEGTETTVNVTTVPEDEKESQTEGSGPRKFKIYENKKLIIGHMPDSYFVHPNTDEDEIEDNGDPTPGKKKKEDPCPPDCSWNPRYGGCVCG